MAASPGHPAEILRRQVPNRPASGPRDASSACTFPIGSAVPGWCRGTAYLTSFLSSMPP